MNLLENQSMTLTKQLTVYFKVCHTKATCTHSTADCRNLATSIADNGSTTIYLLCINQEEGHAEVDKIIIGKLIVVSACLLQSTTRLQVYNIKYG